MLALGLFRVGQLEEHGALLGGAGEHAAAHAELAALAVPLDLVILQEDVLPGVLIGQALLVVPVVQGLLTGGPPPGEDGLVGVGLLCAEGCHRRLDLGRKVDLGDVGGAKAALVGDAQRAPVAHKGLVGPVDQRMEAHQVGAAGIGGDSVVARHQRIGDASLATPLAPRMAHQAVDDVEGRLHQQAEVHEHVGEANDVVKVGARAAVRFHDGQAKEVLEAQRDPLEGMVLHRLYRHKGIRIDHALGKQVLSEHLPAARDLKDLVGRLVAVDEGDVELFEQGHQRDVLFHRAPRVGGVGADLHADEVGLGALAQQAQRGAGDLEIDELLQVTVEVHKPLGRPGLVELDGDALRCLELGP